MYDQPKTTPHITADFIAGHSDSRKWLMYKPGQHEESESEGPKQPLYCHRRDREQGSSWKNGQGDLRSHRFATPRDNRRSNNYKEPRNTDPETDHRNVHESYSDITQKVKVNVPSFDGKIDATHFSNWMVAMEGYFDWYEMSDIERVRLLR